MRRGPVLALVLAGGLPALLTTSSVPIALSQASGFVSIQATPAAIDSVRDWDRRVEQMRREGTLRIRQVRQDSLLPGRTHERLDQYHDGVRVVGGDVARQIDSAGVTLSIFGTMYENLDADPNPKLSASDAEAIAAKDSGGKLRPNAKSELVFLPRDGGVRLVYLMYAFTNSDVLQYSIDARSGAVVDKATALRHQSAVGRGTGVLGDTKKVSAEALGGTFVASDGLRPPDIATFDLRGNFNRAISLLNGVFPPAASDFASDSDNVWTDGANVDAHVYLGFTYDYYFKQFNRRGLDNNDVRIVVLTHTISRDNAQSTPIDIVGQFLTNAFWCPPCGFDGRGIIVFGDGLPQNLTLGGRRWNFLAGGLDVAAHELTHGLSSNSWNPAFGNQPGSLNEAYSDIVGTSVEFFYEPAGSGSQRADYLIGEDVIAPALRSLENPAQFGNVDNFRLGLIDPTDPGRFIYYNSGIATNAFYLAINGGTNRTSGLQVQGVGLANRQQIERAFYRGFTSFLTSNATFSQARAATIQAAIELYGNNSAPAQAIIQAWNATSVP
jgi:bacillolysin